LSDDETLPETRRLEELWGGSFGDDYVDRNVDAYAARGAFWDDLLGSIECERVLEVGCNVGGNLRWVAQHVDPASVVGVDINRKAIAHLHRELPEMAALWTPARELPFRDKWFDLVFTMGVLIHQPETTLPLVMGEMVRCSRRWVLCGEYHDTETVEVPYREHRGALFRRDYGRLFLELFPDLVLTRQGFLGKDEGWDDITWWLFEKPG